MGLAIRGSPFTFLGWGQHLQLSRAASSAGESALTLQNLTEGTQGVAAPNTSSLGQGWGAEKQFRTCLFTPLCSEIQRLCAVKRETRQEGVSTCPPSSPSSSESLCLTHIHRGSRRPAAALRSEDTALAGVAQLVGGSPLGPKGGGISSQLGCTPRSPVRSQVGALMGDNRWMFLCPPLSLLTPLSGIKGRVLK